nr:MAG TPA: DNA REPLICATION protein [Bacteriophage sp.]
MEENNNKELVQSYILTTAKYDYNVYEKRILYRIIELMQELTEGKKLNERYNVQNNLFGDVDIQMPTKSFLKDEKDNNHSIAKKALLALNQKQIKTEDNNVFRAFNLIERPVIDKKAGMVSFRLSPFIASVFMDFSKGYRKYELQTAMSFESVYAMRFYEIFSNQKKPITFTVEQIKEMFNITDKYKYTKDFIRDVISAAKKELDKYSPYTFDFELNRKGRGGKIVSITFTPKYQPQYIDSDLERRSLNQKISSRFSLSKEEVNYLNHNFGFTEIEIRKNIETFKNINAVSDLLNECASIKAKMNEYERRGKIISNRKGYLINALKKKVGKIVSEANKNI